MFLFLSLLLLFLFFWGLFHYIYYLLWNMNFLWGLFFGLWGGKGNCLFTVYSLKDIINYLVFTLCFLRFFVITFFWGNTFLWILGWLFVVFTLLRSLNDGLGELRILLGIVVASEERFFLAVSWFWAESSGKDNFSLTFMSHIFLTALWLTVFALLVTVVVLLAVIVFLRGLFILYSVDIVVFDKFVDIWVVVLCDGDTVGWVYGLYVLIGDSVDALYLCFFLLFMG